MSNLLKVKIETMSNFVVEAKTEIMSNFVVEAKTETIANIDYLEDGNNNWKEHKKMSLELSNSFLRIGQTSDNPLISNYFLKKHISVKDCGSFLEFKLTNDNQKKLINANFCRIRLCPMCAWRRTKKIFSQVSKIVEEINKDAQKEYIFLTLTCKNVTGDELKQQIKDLLSSFKRMFDNNKKINKIALGYFRALEVTKNENGTYHPHIHCIVCVNKSYFTSRDYIKQKEWCKIWQKYLKVDYLPIVDIRKAISSYKSIAELSKYTVKSKDIILNNEQETDNNIMVLHNALHRVRLIGMGGIFKEYHKKLNLEDTEKEDADLINTDAGTEENELLTDIVLKYKWNIGYNNYVLVKE